MKKRIIDKDWGGRVTIYEGEQITEYKIERKLIHGVMFDVKVYPYNVLGYFPQTEGAKKGDECGEIYCDEVIENFADENAMNMFPY